MTREEAIKYSERQLDMFKGKHREFIELAMGALKKERKKAKWIKGFGTLTCSRCGERLVDEQTYIHKNFCPNCGAEMEM